MAKKIKDVICSCAITASLDLDVCCIIVFTRTGYTALAVSKFRPKAQILAVTSNQNVANYCELGYGIHSYVTKGPVELTSDLCLKE